MEINEDQLHNQLGPADANPVAVGLDFVQILEKKVPISMVSSQGGPSQDRIAELSGVDFKDDSVAPVMVPLDGFKW